MPESPRDKRKYERYDTKVEIYFRVTYDVMTKVKFQIQNKTGQGSSRKYAAISRNVSAEGLSFISKKQLSKGDKLYLQVYLPQGKDAVDMEAEVRWSNPVMSKKAQKKLFETGLRVLLVQGESVERSIYYDKAYQIIWSVLLESILGSFRIISQKLAAQRKQK